MPRTDTVSYLPDVYDATHVSRGITAIIGGGPVSGEAIDRFGGRGDDIGADIENLHGGNNGDRLVGDADRNALVGNGGDDLLEGRAQAATRSPATSAATPSATPAATESVAIVHSEGGAGGASDGPAGSRDTFLGDVENFTRRQRRRLPDRRRRRRTSSTAAPAATRSTATAASTRSATRRATRRSPSTSSVASRARVQGGPLDGAPGARDAAAEIENATGGDGADTLTGDSEATRSASRGVNVLSGGPGDDTLDGAGASDDLRGDTGIDTVELRDAASRSSAPRRPVAPARRTNGNSTDGAGRRARPASHRSRTCAAGRRATR